MGSPGIGERCGDLVSMEVSTWNHPPDLGGEKSVDSHVPQDSRRLRLWALSFAIWTLIAFLGAAFSGLYYVVAGGNAPAWKPLLGLSFTDAYTWAVLSPIIYRLSRRYSFDMRVWLSSAGFHAISVLLFATAAAFTTSFVNWGLHLVRGGVPFSFRSELVGLFLENLPRYCLIVAVTQAILYYERLQERRLQSSRLEAQLMQAQLQALKMQLQPHFLFNVLNSIAALARQDPPAAEKMTLQVAELLRMSLQSTDLHQVPLRRELEFVDCYLRIQQTRFQDRLQVRFDIDPTVLDAAVPPLMLQPLVENAIRHGISPRPEPGHILVRAQPRDGSLSLEIVDNGVGLSDLREGKAKQGVGLSNTRARLGQLYGENFELQCRNVPEGGCRVTVRLPLLFGGATYRTEA